MVGFHSSDLVHWDWTNNKKCTSAFEATMKDMVKCITRIHTYKPYNHKKIKHNNIMWIYYGIYRMSWASYQTRKIAGCACAGNAGNVFTAYFGSVVPGEGIKGKEKLLHPTISVECIYLSLPFDTCFRHSTRHLSLLQQTPASMTHLHQRWNDNLKKVP